MIPVFAHRPVLVKEVIEALQPKTCGWYVDGTLGGGGHAEAVLESSSPDGLLFGCDRDERALTATTQRLARFEERMILNQGNFTDLPKWVQSESCDGVLLDLGTSSPQLDQAARGFSFQQDGPLDMRMDQRQKQTAADVINTWEEPKLARLFWEYGGERESRRIAKAIVETRATGLIRNTTTLAAVVERAKPRRGAKTHPATQVFQALRMEVNDELGSLQTGLAGVWGLLKVGGRLAVITFHSLEDRVVKNFGQRLERDYIASGEVDIPELRRSKPIQARWLQRKAIKPSDEELKVNPRSRSAQLRVLEKLK